ncbi:MAG TPA: dihydropteroate synthase [Rhodopila sp.]|nr:dihydropteroate synthase [Rhodopila sp.]
MSQPLPGRAWAGFPLTRPLVMGILNVTPDSFSDGGRQTDVQTAIRAGLQMAADGADIVDVGGESTRPGAPAVPPDIEQARIVPVIRALAAAGVVVSVDTRNAATMRATLDAGARIINDISGLAHDPAAAPLLADRGCPVVLMHMRGTPATMATLATYQDLVAEVRAELLDRVHAALAAGIRADAIALDPGLGFAKRPEHSQALLCRLPELALPAYPMLVGLSRKGFIGALSQEPVADRRLGGSLAGALFAVQQGAAIVRVHDVRETVQAIRVWHSLSFCGTIPVSQTPRERDNHAGRSDTTA